MKASFTSSVSLAALVAVAASTSVHAQEQAPADLVAPVAAEAPVADPSSLPAQEIVIVGSRRAVEQIKSSNAISVFNEEALTAIAPASIASLARSIPGFHAEDSGGEVGNNIAPRGFPLSTQTEFTALQRDGMVVFYDQDILFSQSDRFTRFSNFIAGAQAVRGGSSSVFVGSAPAGYINLLSREGRPGDPTHGDIQFQTNSYDRVGFDGWTTFSLSDSTAAAIGGWWRQDNSGRDPGFNANRGGEINANLVHSFADGRGRIRAEFNLQNDRAIFYLPQPLTGTISDPRSIPGGMSINDGTTGVSASARFLSLPGTPMGDINWDAADGQRDKTLYFGFKLNYDLGGGWSVSNQNRYTDLNTPFNAIINVGNARPLTTIAGEIFARAPGRFAAANGTGGPFFQVRDAGTGEVLATQANANSLNINGFGIDAAYFYRKTEATNFQNDFQLQHEDFKVGSGTLASTFGVYFSDVDGQVLDSRLDTLQSIEGRPRRLDIFFTDAAGAPLASGAAGTYKGLLAGPTGYANVQFNERTIAPYVDFVYDIGSLSLNVGARYETLHVTGQVENPANFDLSRNPATFDPGNPALVSLPFGSGTFRSMDLDFQKLAWTVGGNYKVSSNFALFGRFARGFRMPDPDRYQSLANFDASTPGGLVAIRDFENRPETKPATTTMVEAGFRYNSRPVNVEVNYFFAQAKDLFFNVPTVVNGAIVQRQAFRNTRTHGVEAQISIRPVNNWSIDFSGTYQSPKFFATPVQQALAPNGQTVNLDINGNLPVRTPSAYYQVRSSYDGISTPLGEFSLHGAYSFSGRRFADDANTAKLSAYNLVSLGFGLEMGRGVYVLGDVQNLLKSTGLTEGDPRAGETLVGATNTFNARVVDPQTFILRVGVRF